MWGYCVLNTAEVRVVHDEVGVGNRGLGYPMFRDMGGGACVAVQTREVDPEWMDGHCCCQAFGFVPRGEESTGNLKDLGEYRSGLYFSL